MLLVLPTSWENGFSFPGGRIGRCSDSRVTARATASRSLPLLGKKPPMRRLRFSAGAADLSDEYAVGLGFRRWQNPEAGTYP